MYLLLAAVSSQFVCLHKDTLHPILPPLPPDCTTVFSVLPDIYSKKMGIANGFHEFFYWLSWKCNCSPPVSWRVGQTVSQLVGQAVIIS